jgi:glycosyltransferase involved in cell wall biosynthesis
VRICFLVRELTSSGGVQVIRYHAARLAGDEGFEVEMLMTRDGAGHGGAGPVPVRLVADARGESYDIAVATWWETAQDLYAVNARRRAIFLQSFEQRYYRAHEPFERLGSAAALALPVDFLVVAGWMRDLLAELRPDAGCWVVPNGVDKIAFAPRRFGPGERATHEGPLRIVVEGQAELWFKGVQDAVRAVRQMREPSALTIVSLGPPQLGLGDLESDRVVSGLDSAAMARVYEEADLLLKLSRFEGLPLPPLEAFHLGVPCVVTPFTGHADYVRHGENGLIVGFDDPAGTAGTLDLLARDRGLLGRLSAGALETAASWPSLERAGELFAGALRELDASPPPPPEPALAQMLRTVRLSGELGRQQLTNLRWEIDSYEERLETLRSSRAYRAGIMARRLLGR